MNRTQLEHIIRAASQISGDTEIVVVGSQAIHAQSMKLPSIAFQSEEADVYPRKARPAYRTTADARAAPAGVSTAAERERQADSGHAQQLQRPQQHDSEACNMSSECNPFWLTLLSGLLTPTIAAIAVYIAVRQWRTAHLRLKLDLFDKRLAIHTAVRDLIASIVTTGQVDNAKLVAFVYGTRQARWLLDKDVERYFDEMYGKALDLQTFISEEEGLTADALQDNIRRQREIKDWIAKQYEALDAKFDKFLRIPT
jgi:hypothetical protein